MVDILEYNEARWPTRTLQQEEEQDAQLTSAAALDPPKFQWQPGAGPEQIQDCELLVVACSTSSSCLLRETIAAGKVADLTLVPVLGRPLLPDDDPPVAHTVASLHVAAGRPRVVVCCMEGGQQGVPQDQAGAVARALMEVAPPRQLLALGALTAEQYRGAADAAEEFLGFLLRTTAAAAAAATPSTTPPPLPFLPSGSIVSGLAAAVLTQAELRSIPAQLLVAVEKVPRLVPGTIADLAGAALRALQQLSPAAAAVLAPPLQDKAAQAAAVAACGKQVVPPAIYA